jgi:hypothetical protein
VSAAWFRWGNNQLGRGDGKMRSNLDHVVASEQNPVRVDRRQEAEVRGWPQLPDAEQEEWFEKFSDPALLFTPSQAADPQRCARSWGLLPHLEPQDDYRGDRSG